MSAARFTVTAVELFERDVRLRLPFRFGVATLICAPQAFVRARIRLEDGREAEGAAAEMMVPKWFRKDPALSNEDDIGQLRDSLRAARSEYLEGPGDCAWGHFRFHQKSGLVENFGPALLDRALLDALCRALGIAFFDAIRRNAIGAGLFEGIDLPGFFSSLQPRPVIAVRHTVGLLDALTAADAKARLDDGLPETLEEAVACYRHRYFKLKIGGRLAEDLERLAAIAAVLDRIPGDYFATLDGNEQYEDPEGVVELWRAMRSDSRLKRLVQSILFIEQPVTRKRALERPVAGIDRPVIIDESDDSLDAFPRARDLGYRGVSSKTCKGIYKSLVNLARCGLWGPEYFMSGEDLTLQAGLALQQDLALVSLFGLAHVERNGHHYVNGMAGLPDSEQNAFLVAHPDLYERSHGAVRVRIAEGALRTGSLNCPGYASRAMPEWSAMRRMS
jgi:L-alanine-DL-glutamate epimerase-like enolase superfamily enzyme